MQSWYSWQCIYVLFQIVSLRTTINCCLTNIYSIVVKQIVYIFGCSSHLSGCKVGVLGNVFMFYFRLLVLEQPSIVVRKISIQLKLFFFGCSSHPSGCKVGVLGNVGKVLELQSLSGCYVAHDDLAKSYSYHFIVFILNFCFDDLAKNYV